MSISYDAGRRRAKQSANSEQTAELIRDTIQPKVMERYRVMDKRFWSIIGVIVVVFGAILIVNNHKQSKIASTIKPTNHVEGALSSKVTLVEYGDYQCPACESFYTTVQQVQQKYNDTVRFQFRNLPLSSLHPNAIAGARAAEAADLQGKFWQMHDALYDQTHYDQWAYNLATQSVTTADPLPYFKQYAKELGLNVAQFQTDFASRKVNDRVQADLAAFNKTGKPMSTPAFFVNGKYMSDNNNTIFLDGTGQPSVAAFSKVLDAALKNSK